MVSQVLGMDEPRKRIAAEMSGLGIRYDFGHSEPDKAHPLLGRRMPDLDVSRQTGRCECSLCCTRRDQR